MTWDDYGRRPLPPAWWSRIEDWWDRSRVFLAILLYLLIFVVWPLFSDPEPTAQTMIMEEIDRRSGTGR